MKAELADWKAFYREGVQYHRTAQGSVRRPEVFTPTIIENLAAMSIEKYFMAIFMRRGILPRNHTLLDLMGEAKLYFPLDPILVDSLEYMDSLQRICSLFECEVSAPAANDVPRFLETVDRVARLALQELGSVPAEA